MRASRFLVPVLALLLAPAAALAEPADTSFRSFYSELPAFSEQQLKTTVDANRDPFRAAFASLELYNRTSGSVHAARAVRLLGAIVQKSEQHAWAHYGIALGLTGDPRAIHILRGYGLAQDRLGLHDVKQVIHRHLQLALKYDPEFPEVLSMLGEVERDPYMKVAKVHMFKSAEEYFAAVDAADDSVMANLVRDISPIATRVELLFVTQGDLAKRKDALRLFWKKRSVRDGITPEARIVEHYRRIAFGRSNYGRPVPYYNVWGKRRSGLETEMDDRGLFYVRFGAPDSVRYISSELSKSRKEALGTSVWGYLQADGSYMFYFFLNGTIEADPARFMGPSVFAGLNADLNRLGSGLPVFGQQFEVVMDGNRRLTVKENRELVFAAFDMDGARPRYPRPLTFFHDLMTFRGRDASCTDVVYAVAAQAPTYHLTLAVADTFTWESQSVDTTVTAAAQPGEYVRATGVFCTTPDYNAYVRLSASADSAGTTAGGTFTIPNYVEPGLKISSIIVAGNEDGPFVRGNARLSLIPSNQFGQAQPFRLFYELYNLPAGRPYRTEITITSNRSFMSRLFKGQDATRVSFEGVAEGRDVVQELRTVIPQIQAGRAEVIVKVTDLETNETATSAKSIWVLPTRER